MILRSISIFLFMFSTFFCIQAQSCLQFSTIFERQSQIDSFPLNYPGCKEAINNIIIYTGSTDIDNLNGFNQLTSTKGEFRIINDEYPSKLANLEGLENLDSMSFLAINNLKSPFSTKGLKNIIKISTLSFRNNQESIRIEDMENLSTIGSLSFEGHKKEIDLSGLRNLETIQNKLWIRNNDEIVNLEGLNRLSRVFGGVTIEGNIALSDLNALNNLRKIDGALTISSNSSLLDYSGFKNLKCVGGRLTFYDGIMKSMRGFESLDSIGGSLRISDFKNLVSLTGLENIKHIKEWIQIYENPQLVSLAALKFLDLHNPFSIIITDNEKLEICNEPGVCNFINRGGDYYFEKNGPGCENNFQVENSCNLSRIYVPIFYDLNKNGLFDIDENLINSIDVLVNNEKYNFFNSFNYIYLEDGINNISIDLLNNPEWDLTTDSINYSVNIDANYNYDTLSFGVFPNEKISNINTVVNSGTARCNSFIVLDVNILNSGTTITEGIAWLQLDNRIKENIYIDNPDTVVSNKIGWKLDSFFPGQKLSRKIKILVPLPPDISIGEKLIFESFVEYLDSNGIHFSKVYHYDPIVRCAFDPNDKIVNPARDNFNTLFDEPLIYTIRFQNTGNDIAYDVIIRDTLDKNLNFESFRIISTSHPHNLHVDIENEKYITFNFKDIFLPDSSSSFEYSQGYVCFLVNSNAGLEEKTIIENTASIYFDFNPPVVTNTTESVLVSELPVAVHEVENGKIVELHLSPNPTNGKVLVSSDDSQNAILKLHDLTGRLITEQPFRQEGWLDLQELDSGIYFISIQTESYLIVEKVVMNRR